MTARTALHCSRIAILLLFSMTAAWAQPTENPERVLERHEKEYRESLKRPKNEEFSEDVRGREEWFMFQRRFPYDVIPAGARDRAMAQTQRMQDQLDEARAKGDRFARLLAANTWEPIGPTNVGGRITAVAQHPVLPGVIYIGAASGGVWKSTDGGATWGTTFDKQEALTVGAIGLDYSNPDNVYVGTGERYGHTEEYFGHGVFKSTDAGATWKNIGLTNVGGFAKIYVHRQNPLVVYAAGAKENGGFYRSEDGGERWTRTLSGTMYDLTVNPANSNELFVSTANSVHYSSDGGKTFTARTTGINVAGAIRLSVAMAPTDPNKVYVLIARYQSDGMPNYAEFYASSDKGLTWHQEHEFGGGFFNEQGFYNNGLLVHPTRPGTVLALGIDVHRTVDGGVNFVNWTDAYGHLGDPTAVHADQHAIEYSPQNADRVLLGNDGGLYLSEDGGETWQKLTLALPVTQFYKMDIDVNNPGRVYGGTQDNGSSGYFGSGDRATWTTLSGGDGFFVAVDPYQSDIVYSEIYYGTPIYRTNVTAPGVSEQIDEVIELTNGDRGDWSTPLVAGISDGRLYSGRRFLWRTADGGGNWQQLRPGSSGLMSAVGISPLAPKLIIGTKSGEVRYSVDDGATWKTSSGIPRRYISDLRYDFNRENTLYATVSGTGSKHVFRSDNDGASFVDISGNLPDVPVNALAVDPSNSDHLFVGTDAGVFVTVDGGKVWFPFNDNLPLAPVVDLKINDGNRTMYAATHGRSMFKVNIATIEAQPFLVRPAGGSTYQTPGPLPVAWSGFSGSVRVYVSYNGGDTYTLLADDVTGDSVVLSLPVVRSSNARVKVAEIGSDRAVVSDEFNLTAKNNGTELTSRGFVPEAIEIRRGLIWASDRNSDSIIVLKLTPPLSRAGILRSGIPGRIRDLAYDSVADRFYVLVTAADFSAPKLYRMDTLGVSGGEITLPAAITRASGIAVTGEGLTVIAPGAEGNAGVIDDAGQIRRTTGVFAAGTEDDRRGLAWDGRGMVQAVIVAAADAPFPSQFERAPLVEPLRVAEAIPAVLPSGKRVEFVGLAVDMSTPDTPVYWVSDTAGAFYRFTQLFSGVNAGPAYVYRPEGLRLGGIGPNPVRDGAEIHFTVMRAGTCTLDLFTVDGVHVAGLFNGRVEPGDRTIRLDARALASGVYYLVLANDHGDRDTRPVVVMK